MRVVLVGSRLARERLRLSLEGTTIEVVGEAATLDAARAHEIGTDAYLVAPGARADVDDDARSNEPLTPRELEVLRLVAEGLPNKMIATRLGISDQTVKFHVASIAGKLGAENRTAAVRLAIRRGLVDL